jgi:hypothetical protein
MNDQTIPRSASSIHKEIVLEEHLVGQLVSKHGYVLRAPDSYDRSSALDRELLFRFLKGATRRMGEAGGALCRFSGG